MIPAQTKTLKIASTAGWIAIILSVLIMLASGALRLTLMSQDAATADDFDVRYIQHPWASLIHIIPGVLFLTFAPLQFIARIRQRRINFHRGLGKVLVTCAAMSGVASLLVTFLFPAFGGISTQSATGFAGVLFLFSLSMAIRHMLKKEFRQHREWMVRTFALAMSVAVMRIFLILLRSSMGLSTEEAFGAAFWLAIGVNLLVAEAWINYTRRPGQIAEGA